jgi:hypothetical protein
MWAFWRPIVMDFASLSRILRRVINNAHVSSRVRSVETIYNYLLSSITTLSTCDTCLHSS